MFQLFVQLSVRSVISPDMSVLVSVARATVASAAKLQATNVGSTCVDSNATVRAKMQHKLAQVVVCDFASAIVVQRSIYDPNMLQLWNQMQE